MKDIAMFDKRKKNSQAVIKLPKLTITEMVLQKAIFPFAGWVRRLDEPERAGWTSKLVDQPFFERVCSLVIFLNTFFVAYSADAGMHQSPGEATSGFIYYGEFAFLVWFVLELILRMLHHRLYFFVNESAHWNWFDFFLVLLALVDTALQTFMNSSGGGNVSFMRVLRLAKLAKILRTLRVMRIFRELSMILESFAKCLLSMLWSFILLVFSIYVFSLMFVQGLSTYIQEECDDEELRELVFDHFGNTVTSMITLYMAVTGGDDWVKFYNTTQLAGAFYPWLFLFFTFFYVFALFNLLTGIFVEKAVQVGAVDREEVIAQQQRIRQRTKDEFRHLCRVLDQEETGFIDRSIFVEGMKNPNIVNYMASAGLEVRNPDSFFDCISKLTDTEELVSVEAFVEACMSMKGQATGLDMQLQFGQTNKVERQVCELQHLVEDQFRSLLEAMDDSLRRGLGGRKTTLFSLKSLHRLQEGDAGDGTPGGCQSPSPSSDAVSDGPRMRDLSAVKFKLPIQDAASATNVSSIMQLQAL
eukprot:TRINITY_DN30123_c0_g1_i1.p1 TRINITY_DN30123_c0_g1~~TRINITY_DN30123_c0_g1_i1.p1  ORF type:complete len:528 (+),score=135.72 TRINITY_DN30123_c0_g1_i1:397-1980(+)